MLRLRVVSDIHLEFRKNKGFSIQPFTTVQPNDITGCILAGDIGHPMTFPYRQFLQQTKAKFQYVFVIAGNHEYYRQKGRHYDMATIDHNMEQICHDNGCIWLHPGTSYIIPSTNIKVMGCTLWTRIPSELSVIAEHGMNDYRQIVVEQRFEGDPWYKPVFQRFLTPNDTTTLHQEAVEWIKAESAKARDNNHRIIMVSHHAPSFQMIHDRFRSDLLRFCYASNLEEIITDPIVVWISGHTHHATHINVNGVQCIANCVGYPGERGDHIQYNKDMELSLPL
jgi:DNA repair exonuclease SbcCD nuclease subunit